MKKIISILIVGQLILGQSANAARFADMDKYTQLQRDFAGTAVSVGFLGLITGIVATGTGDDAVNSAEWSAKNAEATIARLEKENKEYKGILSELRSNSPRKRILNSKIRKNLKQIGQAKKNAPKFWAEYNRLHPRLLGRSLSWALKGAGIALAASTAITLFAGDYNDKYYGAKALGFGVGSAFLTNMVFQGIRSLAKRTAFKWGGLGLALGGGLVATGIHGAMKARRTSDK